MAAGIDRRIVKLERRTMPRPAGRIAQLAATMDPIELTLRFIAYCYGSNRRDYSAGTGPTAAEREAMHASIVADMTDHFGLRWFDCFGFDHPPTLDEMDSMPEAERRRAVDLLAARGDVPGATDAGAFGKLAVSTKFRAGQTPQ